MITLKQFLLMSCLFKDYFTLCIYSTVNLVTSLPDMLAKIFLFLLGCLAKYFPGCLIIISDYSNVSYMAF